MLVILSSSKTQTVSPAADLHCYQPPLIDQAEQLLRKWRKLDPAAIGKMMKISGKLAQNTYERFQQFAIPHTPGPAGAALTTFQGDVFAQLDTKSYLPEDYLFAHTRVCILSGLYGILRPLDLMQPYRLEMGCKIKSDNTTSLYDFWGTSVTGYLNDAFQDHDERLLINCASKEYSRVVIGARLAVRMLNVSFKQHRGGNLKTIAIYAKRARGLFVDWYIKNRVSKVTDLPAFNRGGYRFRPDLSSESEYVFTTVLS